MVRQQLRGLQAPAIGQKLCDARRPKRVAAEHRRNALSLQSSPHHAQHLAPLQRLQAFKSLPQLVSPRNASAAPAAAGF